MPAVKNNAALPSQESSSKSNPGGKRSFHSSARALALQNLSAPYWSEGRQAAFHNTPPSESNVTASTPSPRAAQTYVRGNVEPDSYQRYEFVSPPAHAESGKGGPLPSSHIAHLSSTGAGESAHPNTHDKPKNEAGVGSSSQIKHHASTDPASHTTMQSKQDTHTPKEAAKHETRLPPDFNTTERGPWRPPIDDAERAKARPPTAAADNPTTHPKPSQIANSENKGPEKVGI